jgi:hypothetical protein
LVEQWIVGTHEALVIFTGLESTARLAILVTSDEIPPVDLFGGVEIGEASPVDRAPLPAGATAPPASLGAADPRADAALEGAARQSHAKVAITAFDVNCLWNAALATTIPSWLPDPGSFGRTRCNSKPSDP